MRFMLAPFADRIFRRGRIYTGAVSRAAGALVLTCAAFCAAPASAQMMRLDAIPAERITHGAEPFGRSTSFAPAGPLWAKWRGIDDGFAKDEDALSHCRSDKSACSPGMKRLIALIDEARGLTGRRRLAIVNRAINLSIAYTSDMAQFGTMDVWSSPMATFTSGRGDCEDYAIAKMFTLRAAGIAAEDLRFVVARTRGGDAHAVLAVRNEDQWIVLDNRSMVLVEDRNAQDLSPLFALDAAGVREFGAPVIAVAAKQPEMQSTTAVTLTVAGPAPADPLDLSMWF
jgi:predicted transglutaminase-like cysteine proteinase